MGKGRAKIKRVREEEKRWEKRGKDDKKIGKGKEKKKRKKGKREKQWEKKGEDGRTGIKLGKESKKEG
jgi:hypothetical protein